VYLGLAGMYRLHDPYARALPIPKGAYDIPLIVRDALFDSNGQLLFDDNGQSGLYGDVILVNNKPWPVMRVERRKYRFRVLNASISRSFRWQLDGGSPFTVIGTDGGLMPAPVEVRELRHGVAERYEIIIDFAKYPIGARVVLRNLSNKNNIDYEHTDKVMAFDVVGKPTSYAGNTIPAQLYPDNYVMKLRPEQATGPQRRFETERKNGQWTLNGKTWADIEASNFEWVAAKVEKDAIEIWELSNPHGGWNHPLHIHLIDFQILDRNGQPPMPHERGPKDVVYLGENETVRVLAQFKHQVGKYMIHCHNLPHEDHDMMTQFQVGDGGDDPIYGEPNHPGPAPRP